VFVLVCRSPWFFCESCLFISTMVAKLSPIYFPHPIARCVSPIVDSAFHVTKKRLTFLFSHYLQVPKGRAPSSNREIPHREELHAESKVDEFNRLEAGGVYTLRICRAGTNVSGNQDLAKMKFHCEHNARVYRQASESEKAEVWDLLAQIVEGRILNTGNAYDGWGGVGGGALGVHLVQRVLAYYEILGDVQMLSTMVCVLRGHKNHELSGKTPWHFLSRNEDLRYDTYIRRYEGLLFCWGLLGTRAELKKHLFQVLPCDKNGQVDDGPSVIGLTFTCPQCGGLSDTESNFCHVCKDYAFRCALCDNAVRGLFTVCDW
jgi:hypothetical protein